MKDSRFTFRKLFGKIHLWLGLISGIIIFFVCLSGTIFTFRFELDKAMYPSLYYVTVPEKGERFPLDSIKAIYEKKYDASLTDITIPAKESRLLELTLRSNTIDSTYSCKVNPYTGAFVENRRTAGDEFLNFIYNLHTNLLFGNRLGEGIVGVSTIIFLIMIISGLVLWYRKKLSNIHKGLVFKKTGNWKRIIYDLHNILGFYTSIVLIVIALTGLTYTFSSFDEFVKDLLIDKETTAATTANTAVNADSTKREVLPLSAFVKEANAVLNFRGDLIIFMPADSGENVKARRFKSGFFATYAPDKIVIDPYSAKLTSIEKFSDYSFNEKIKRLFYQLHAGSIFGTFTKIIYCIICLIATSLPLTGTIIWWNKNFRKKKKQNLV